MGHGWMAWGRGRSMKLCWMSGLIDGQCLSHFSGAVTKCLDQGNLEKEVFIWAYGIRVHCGGKTWQQVSGLAAGAGS